MPLPRQAKPTFQIGLQPAVPLRPFALWRIAIAGACLLLLLCTGRAALAAGDKPATAKTGADKSSGADKLSGGEKVTDSDDDSSADVKEGFRLEKVKEIVVWNEHNGKRRDNGTKTCSLTLLLDGKTVWERKDLEIPWEEKKWANRVIEVGNVQADTLRVEITAWNEKGGGLAEIEVLDTAGNNLGFGGKVKTSSERTPVGRLGGAALIDKIYDSPSEEAGYWLLPDGQEGWAEIELVPQQIPPPAKERTPIKIGKKKIAPVAMGAELFVTCEDSFEIYVNGEHILSGHGQRVFSRHFKIANGDVVTARCEGSGTKGGFCILIRFPSGHFLSTMNGWQVYNPGNPSKWFSAAKGSAQVAKGTSGWAERLMKDESGLKHPIPQIWGTGNTSYLVLVADTKVIKPKMKPGQRKR